MTESETSNGSEEKDKVVVVHVFGKTDVGLVRDHNEDNFLIADLTDENRSIMPEVRTHMVGPRGSLFVVCDGMGGAAAGEVASRIGVDTIYEMMQESNPPADDFVLARRLDTSICEAGTRIFTAAKLNRGQRGMGTTVTAAALRESRLVLGQVGDSRAHIVRNGKMVQVTKDQSLVQQLIDAKQLTEEEAKTFDKSNIILQALGTTSEVHVDMTSVELRRGDILVMCSDGLSGFVEPEQILDAVLQNEEPMDACRILTELACEGGGEDNITVVVARFDGELLEEPKDSDVLQYEKYEFPRVTETTTRAALPKFKDDEKTEAGDEKKETVASNDKKKDSRDAGEQSDKKRSAPAETPRGTSKAAKDTSGFSKETDTDDVPAKKSKAGLIIGILAVVLLGGGFAGYLSMGGDSDIPETSVPLLENPAQPVPAPQTIEPSSSGQVPAPTLPPIEEPVLAPIDEQAIVGNGDGGGDEAGKPLSSKPQPDEKSGQGTLVKEAKAKKNEGSKPKSQASKPKKDDGAASKPAVSKPKKKKKEKSVIEENPYG